MNIQFKILPFKPLDWAIAKKPRANLEFAFPNAAEELGSRYKKRKRYILDDVDKNPVITGQASPKKNN